MVRPVPRAAAAAAVVAAAAGGDGAAHGAAQANGGAGDPSHLEEVAPAELVVPISHPHSLPGTESPFSPLAPARWQGHLTIRAVNPRYGHDTLARMRVKPKPRVCVLARTSPAGERRSDVDTARRQDAGGAEAGITIEIRRRTHRRHPGHRPCGRDPARPQRGRRRHDAVLAGDGHGPASLHDPQDRPRPGEENLVAWRPELGVAELGLGLVSMTLSRRRSLRDAVRPHLEALSRRVDETVDLVVLRGDMVGVRGPGHGPPAAGGLRASARRSPSTARRAARPSWRRSPADEVERLLPGKLQRFTAQRSPTARSCSRSSMSCAPTRIAYDRDEHVVGVSAVGAVIHDAWGEIASVTIPVPSQRLRGPRGGARRRAAGDVR